MTTRGTCYLHIGTHKTGTTSIQWFLAKNEAVLRRHGALIPKSGRPVLALRDNYCGHHNIAWELNGALDKFSKDEGTWHDAVAEIDREGLKTVILTSEDFEYLNGAPEALQRMKTDLDAIGYDTKVVAYLRGQAYYAQSLYVELTKAGSIQTFPSFLQTVLKCNATAPDRRWATILDYGQLLEPFESIFGKEHMIVRPFIQSKDSNAVLIDFMTSVGVFPEEEMEAPPALNESLGLAHVLSLLEIVAEEMGTRSISLRNALQTWYAEPERESFQRRFDVLLLDEVRSYIDHFRKMNLELGARYGIAIPFTSYGDLPQRDETAWHTTRLHRTLLDRLSEIWKIPDAPVFGHDPVFGRTSA